MSGIRWERDLYKIRRRRERDRSFYTRALEIDRSGCARTTEASFSRREQCRLFLDQAVIWTSKCLPFQRIASRVRLPLSSQGCSVVAPCATLDLWRGVAAACSSRRILASLHARDTIPLSRRRLTPGPGGQSAVRPRGWYHFAFPMWTLSLLRVIAKASRPRGILLSFRYASRSPKIVGSQTLEVDGCQLPSELTPALQRCSVQDEVHPGRGAVKADVKFSRFSYCTCSQASRQRWLAA